MSWWSSGRANRAKFWCGPVKRTGRGGGGWLCQRCCAAWTCCLSPQSWWDGLVGLRWEIPQVGIVELYGSHPSWSQSYGSLLQPGEWWPIAWRRPVATKIGKRVFVTTSAMLLLLPLLLADRSPIACDLTSFRFFLKVFSNSGSSRRSFDGPCFSMHLHKRKWMQKLVKKIKEIKLHRKDISIVKLY